MPDFTAPLVAARFAAAAARLSVNQFHHVVGDGFPVEGARSAGGHLRFSPLDIVRVAVAGRLLACGLSLAEAAHVVAATVDEAMFAPARCGVELPCAVISMRLAGMVAFVVPRTSGLPIVQVGNFDCRAEAAIVIRICDIAEDALRRLGQTHALPSCGVQRGADVPQDQFERQGSAPQANWSSPAPINTAATADKGNTP